MSSHSWFRLALMFVFAASACTALPPSTQPSSPNIAAAPADAHDHVAAAAMSPNAGLTLPLSSPVPGCEVAAIDLAAAGGAPFANPPVVRSENGLLRYNLKVQYGQNQIGHCNVTLRSYNGSLMGPTLVVTPGDTIRITLTNMLPTGAISFTQLITDGNGLTKTQIINVSAQPSHVMNQLGAFNTTNLHVHGMHVSPVGNSDNVLLEIGPGQTFLYEIKVPADHPAGTYWYHAHNHGSTATHVSSGMAGALIVSGGLDTLDDLADATNQILVFQQIAYDEAGFIEPAGNNATWVTPPVNPQTPPGYFSPCAWEPTMREHTINGQLFPTLTMTAGEVQRWRMIHAGVRESIGAELHGPYLSEGTPTYTQVLALPTLTLTEIAVDGIALGAPVAWQQVELEPGYRSDVLVQPMVPGTYFLIDNGVQASITTQDPVTGFYTTTTQSSRALTCSASNEQPNFLTRIVVTADEARAPAMTVPITLPAPPLTSIIAVTTSQSLSAALGLKTVSDLNNALGGVEVIINSGNLITQAWVLSPTEPIDGLQLVDFSVTAHTLSNGVTFVAGNHPFDPTRVRKLPLGNTEEWVVNTRTDSLYYAHPFHIHVNPFQTWRYGPDGIPQAVWRDTQLIRQGQPSFLFTRYEDYIGQFVYHCHILDHEDAGMMELLEVVPPGGALGDGH